MANNPENVEPYRIRSAEEAREKGRVGGLRSGIARREKASLKEAARLVLSMDSVNPKMNAAMDLMGLDADEKTNAAMVTATMVMMAAEGDVKAYEALSRNMALLDAEAEREREADGSATGGPTFPLIDTASLIPGCYADPWRDIMAGRHSEYIARSGRGSLKSTVILTEAPIMLMLMDPKLCGTAFRRVGNTLRDSIFATFVSSIHRMGLGEHFEWTVSPMAIRAKHTGQVILFRGLDDEGKAKSLQLPDPDMYIGFAVWEEFDQNKGMQAVRKVEQSVKRGQAPHFWTLRAFNTPPDAEHWANLHFEEAANNPDALTVQSNYTDVPPEFLGDEFLKDAERLKATSPEAYANEYLGQTVGLTGRVFENAENQTITDEQIAEFKWSRCGMDWGFEKDPWVWLRIAYDRKARVLYVFDELFNTVTLDEPNIAKVKMRLAERDAAGKPLTSDDGEPAFRAWKPANEIRADISGSKDIATWRHHGVQVVGASKRIPVDDGIRWLQKRARIVIDRKRCPFTHQEFVRYQALDDEAGRFRGYPDKDNHSIDAVRYAAFDLIADPDTP